MRYIIDKQTLFEDNQVSNFAVTYFVKTESYIPNVEEDVLFFKDKNDALERIKFMLESKEYCEIKLYQKTSFSCVQLNF
jgi:hypothetical protein